MSYGKIELTEHIIHTNEVLYEYFKTKGHEIEKNIFNAGHEYILWADEIINDLKYLL